MVDDAQTGTLLNIASMVAKRPTAGAYSISKTACWMLTRCLAHELGECGIRVNAIGPGYVETELFDNMVRAGVGDDVAAQEQFRKVRAERSTLGKFPEATYIAQTALFLSSDAGRMYTGSILHPDAGMTSVFGGG